MKRSKSPNINHQHTRPRSVKARIINFINHRREHHRRSDTNTKNKEKCNTIQTEPNDTKRKGPVQTSVNIESNVINQAMNSTRNLKP